MSMLARITTPIAVLMLLVAGPASATHTQPGEPFVPEYIETPVFLHCNGESKVSNVHAIQGTLVSWNTTAPTTSYTQGGGCGTADTFLGGTTNHNPIYDFPMQGSFKGNIDNVTVRLWAIEASGSRALNEFTVDLHLVIDGVDVLTRPTQAHATPIASSTGITRLYEVTVTNVGLSSLAAHNATHDIQLTVYPKFANGSGILAWVYDATEIDSGLVFNDKTPAAVTVARNG